MKKIIITVTILSLLNMIGCYYYEQMNPVDFNYLDKEDIRVTTKDTTYNLSGNDYYFESDTLFVSLTKKLDKQTKLKFKQSIPLREIEVVELEKTDAVATIFTSLGIFVGILGFMILLNYLNNDFYSN